MTIDEINLLTDKAKKRKDGVYTYQSFYYAVKNGNFIAFVTYFGELYLRCGLGNSFFGQFKSYERKNKLIEWLKTQ